MSCDVIPLDFVNFFISVLTTDTEAEDDFTRFLSQEAADSPTVPKKIAKRRNTVCASRKQAEPKRQSIDVLARKVSRNIPSSVLAMSSNPTKNVLNSEVQTAPSTSKFRTATPISNGQALPPIPKLQTSPSNPKVKTSSPIPNDQKSSSKESGKCDGKQFR